MTPENRYPLAAYCSRSHVYQAVMEGAYSAQQHLLSVPLVWGGQEENLRMKEENLRVARTPTDRLVWARW